MKRTPGITTARAGVGGGTDLRQLLRSAAEHAAVGRAWTAVNVT